MSKSKEFEVEVHIGNYIKKGWNLFNKYTWGFIGFTALFLFINIILNIIPVIGPIIAMIINSVFLAGYYIVALQLLKNEPTKFGDFFKGFNYFMPLFLYGLVGGIFIVLGFIIVLPGIYLLVGYLFTILFIVDKKLDFWQAMEASRKRITKNWFSMFGFWILFMIMLFLGLIPFGFGLLVVTPLMACSITIAYDDMVGIEAT